MSVLCRDEERRCAILCAREIIFRQTIYIPTHDSVTSLARFLAPHVNHLNFTFIKAFTLAPAVKSSLTILAWPPWQATNNAVPPSALATSTVAPALRRIFVMSMKPPCAAKKSAVVPVCVRSWELIRNLRSWKLENWRTTRLALTSAPCSSSSNTQPVCPPAEARIRGVVLSFRRRLKLD